MSLRKPENNFGPAFNRLWGASATSNLADGILAIAAPLLAISLTQDPILISLMSALVMLPWLFFAIPVGTLVDRVDRRYLLAAANGTRFAIAALLALSISTDRITIYWLFLAAFIIGICEVVSDTTSHSLIPQILVEEQFEKGNSRLQISETVIQNFIGAPLSGFLYAIAIYLPFMFNSLGFAIAALLALAIPVSFLQDVRKVDTNEVKPSFIEDMKFGIKYLYEDKIILRLVLTTTSIGFFAALSNSTIVLFIINIMRVKPALFGVVMAVQGLGAIAGALTAPRLSTCFGRSRVLSYAMLITSIAMAMIGISPNIWYFLFAGTLIGFFVSNLNVLLMATYQSLIPAHLYGRIHGTRRTLLWGLMPFGSLLGGAIAQVNLRLPMIVAGICATFISLSAFTFVNSIGKSK